MTKLPAGITTISGHSAQSLIIVPETVFDSTFLLCGLSRFVPLSSGKKPGPVILICAHAPCAKQEQSSSVAKERLREFKIKGGKDTKIQGVKRVLARRNPMLLSRLRGLNLLRLAERELAGSPLQEPPRSTRTLPLQSVIQALPSIVTPA